MHKIPVAEQRQSGEGEERMRWSAGMWFVLCMLALSLGASAAGKVTHTAATSSNKHAMHANANLASIALRAAERPGVEVEAEGLREGYVCASGAGRSPELRQPVRLASVLRAGGRMNGKQERRLAVRATNCVYVMCGCRYTETSRWRTERSTRSALERSQAACGKSTAARSGYE